jgi:hypothetical protein
MNGRKGHPYHRVHINGIGIDHWWRIYLKNLECPGVSQSCARVTNRECGKKRYNVRYSSLMYFVVTELQPISPASSAIAPPGIFSVA